MALRQVYPDPNSENPALGKVDIIAVHGLNPRSKDEEVHGWNTWRAGKDGPIWLRDELPKFVPDARIFLYIYESTAVYGSSRSTFIDRANKLLECIRIERSEDPNSSRPLILLGHSLGGLLIEQALINAHNNPDYTSIKQATFGLVFFATPHNGGENMLVALGGKAATIAHGLGFQKDIHREQLRHQLYDYRIRSFWGTQDTIVNKESAQFGLPGNMERIVPLNANHRSICKFGQTQVDRDNWKIVKSNIKELYDLALKECELRQISLDAGTFTSALQEGNGDSNSELTLQGRLAALPEVERS